MSNKGEYKLTESIFVTGGVPRNYISKIEEKLDCRLPNSYKEFVVTLGYAFLGGSTIEGVALDKSLTIVEETLNMWDIGMPNNLIVLEDADEFMYCFSKININNFGEYQIICCDKFYWDEYDIAYDSFFEYFVANMIIENV